MPDTSHQPSGASEKPPGADDEKDRPGREDWREPGGDVREPPPPGTAGSEEKFPRKGEI
jgi:hypothetical protein